MALRLPSLAAHIFLAAAALAVIAIIARSSPDPLPAQVTEPTSTVDIAVEYSTPLGLRLEIASRGPQGLLTLSHDGGETIQVSLPADWKRSEVRGIELHELYAEPPAVGFVRWHLPPSAKVTFRLPETPGNILVHPLSSEILKVTALRVDLDTDTVERDVALVKEKATLLW